MSTNHSKLFDSLLLKLTNPDPHTRNLGFLITRALLGLVSGDDQVNVAQRVLDAMDITALEDFGNFMKGADSLREVGREFICGSSCKPLILLLFSS